MSSLGVSLVTLNSAVASLEQRGLLTRRRGSGLYVLEATGPLACLVISPRMLLHYGTSPFYPLLVRSLEQEAQDAGIRLHLHFSQWVDPILEAERPTLAFEQGFLRSLKEGVYQGALTIGTFEPLVRILKGVGVPSAGFGGAATWQIETDADVISRVGLQRLLGQGVTQVEAWNWAGPWQACFLALCREFGLSGTVVLHPEEDKDSHWASEPQASMGFRHAMERLCSAALPEALILYDDAYTQGVLMAMTKLGLKPGADLKVVSHGIAGSPTLWGWEPGVETVILDPRDIAKGMVGALCYELGLARELPAMPEGTRIVQGIIYPLA
jgi:hypothetical protein